MPPERFAARRERLGRRQHRLLAQHWENKHARRLVKRLRRHEAELFTFLDHPEVPSDNNHAERQIRPAVMVRKNSYANGSDDGAETQAVLMSVFRTLKQRGHNTVFAVLTCCSRPPANRSTTELAPRKSLKSARLIHFHGFWVPRSGMTTLSFHTFFCDLPAVYPLPLRFVIPCAFLAGLVDQFFQLLIGCGTWHNFGPHIKDRGASDGEEFRQFLVFLQRLADFRVVHRLL